MGTRPNPRGNRPRPRNKPVLRKAAKVLPASVVKALLKMKIARQEAAKKQKKQRKERADAEYWEEYRKHHGDD